MRPFAIEAVDRERRFAVGATRDPAEVVTLTGVAFSVVSGGLPATDDVR